MNCGTCKFWADGKFKLMANGNTSPDDAKNENAGTCRRYAPSARQNNFRTWPVTVVSDFCHDYADKNAPVIIHSNETFEEDVPGTVAPSPKSDPLEPIKKVFGRRKKGA